MRSLASFILVPMIALASAAGCVKNPATGERQLSLISEQQEIALGQQAREEAVQSLGLYDSKGIQEYVSAIGKKLAASSERPNLPWSFQVIDDASVNAFALPGGPIFVTRGILTHLNSEAELAAVVGHEIGHVTARHSVNMISKQQLAQLGLGVGSLFLPQNLRGLGQLAGAGLGLLFLKYGREAESQADELGFRYALKDGYDVRATRNLFVTLERVGAGQGQGRLPEWLSTHPNPENRLKATDERLAKLKQVDFSKLQTNRDGYLDTLQHVVFGENPRNGFFRGNTFLHPELRFQFTFPSGWKAANQPGAVTGVGPRQDAAIQLAAAGNLSPEQAAQKFYAMPGVRRGDAQLGAINSLPAVAGYFTAQTEQGVLAGIVSFISYGGKTFQVVAYTPAERLSAHDAEFRRAIGTFGPLTDPAALGVQPARLEIVKLPREMSLAEANAQFPSTVPIETVALINGAMAQTRLPAGIRFKRVTGGTPASATTSSRE
ncbi:MAG TPA: M48 family metalloprotease [Myxococcaceae bacterium]|nr:M48 family metalloprotease [Myxococcaceae bacterium]